MERGLPCPVIIKTENPPTDEIIERPIKVEVPDDDPTIPSSSETNDEPNLDLFEPKIELITYDSEIVINDNFNLSLKPPEQNLYVLPTGLTCEEIQMACVHNQHSRLLEGEEQNLGNSLEPPNLSDMDNTMIGNPEVKTFTEVQPTGILITVTTEPDVKFECKLCSMELESDAHLRIHVGVCSLNHKYRNRYCVTCNKKFREPKNLKDHLLRYHATEEERASLFKFKCHTCPKQYQTKRDLTHHLKCHNEVKTQVKTSESSSKPKPFKCSQPNCVKEFKTYHDVQRHIATHFGLKPFSCQFPNCNKKFARGEHLKRHSRIHIEEQQPYKCTVQWTTVTKLL